MRTRAVRRKGDNAKPSEDQQPIELTGYFTSATTGTAEDIVESRTKIDLIYVSFYAFNMVKQHGLLRTDIVDLIDKQKFNTNQNENAYIGMFKNLHDGKLADLPFLISGEAGLIQR